MGVASLHFTNEVDLTGLATLALALATAALASWTAVAVRQGKTQIERTSRPVLVPVVDRARSFVPWGSAGFPLEPTPDPRGVRYYVPVCNVGMGPALQVTGTLSFGDRHGNPSTHGIETTCNVKAAGIAHNEPFAILVFPSKPATATGLALTVEYEDVAGRRWSTIARYDLDDRAYHDVTIRG